MTGGLLHEGRGVGRLNGRGQSGLTMIELLITIILAGMVLGPIVGIGFYVMRQYRPTVDAAKSSKQLRLFRTVIADDWASAAQIVIDPPGPPLTIDSQCNGQGYGTDPVRVALVTSYLVDGKRLRILYRQIPNPDGTFRLTRQVCEHRATATGVWQLGGRAESGPYGRIDVLLKKFRALVIPTGHGCSTSIAPPFVPCDMNITAIGIDGDRTTPFNAGSPFSSTAQRATVRLHQQVGPVS